MNFVDSFNLEDLRKLKEQRDCIFVDLSLPSRVSSEACVITPVVWGMLLSRKGNSTPYTEVIKKSRQ